MHFSVEASDSGTAIGFDGADAASVASLSFHVDGRGIGQLSVTDAAGATREDTVRAFAMQGDAVALPPRDG